MPAARQKRTTTKTALAALAPVAATKVVKKGKKCRNCTDDKRKKRCEPVTVGGRFNQCQKCHDLCQSKRGGLRLQCSLTDDSLCFYATDFTFKHAPPPYGVGSEWDCEHANLIQDATCRDGPDLRMQYFYIEDPYERAKPWAPLYLRRELNAKGITPYHLTPMASTYQPIRGLADRESGKIEKAWEMHNDIQLEDVAPRPIFAADEKVVTCRRICSLYGYLDLEHPRPDTFRPMIWKAGRYEVIWRLQFFDVRETGLDVVAIGARSGKKSFTDLLNDDEWNPQSASINSADGFNENEFPEDDHLVPDGDCTNPMRFPTWPDHKEPSYPGRPLLRLSVGYGKLPYAVAGYDLEYGPDQASIADQVLVKTSEPHLRLDHRITAEQFQGNTRNGWIEVKSDGLFDVVDGRPPVFVVSNIDTGGWQGGFRFGGIELRRWDESKPKKGGKGRECGACKRKPTSNSRFSCAGAPV